MVTICISAGERGHAVNAAWCRALRAALISRGLRAHMLGTPSGHENAHTQSLIDWHNSMARDLDVCIRPERLREEGAENTGVQVFFADGERELATEVAAAIAQRGGVADCGAHLSAGPFLVGTHQHALLIALAQPPHDAAWGAVADALVLALPLPAAPPVIALRPHVKVELTLPNDVELRLFINGEELLLPD
jgi:hypothetical protein